jgi:lipid II:glycine glycyltransferase (peptidoglycan interpeptide bridge formation enzyme)
VTATARFLRDDELAGWDAGAVDAPGGHVLQSRAWAEHRRAAGWRPRYVEAGACRALALVRPWPVLGGGSAYLPRGPVGPGIPWAAAAEGAVAPDAGAGAAIGEALDATGALLAREGIDVIAADPEVAAADERYGATLAAAGFRPIAEIQPSRHRMALALPAGGDAAAVLDGVAKATRQRIRRAERDRVTVLRHDARWTPGTGGDTGFVVPGEAGDQALDRFYGLLRATGDRRGFGFAGRGEFVAWWRRALAAGHLVYLEAREGEAGGDVLGGLVLYRHGTRLSTAHSADRAERRRDHPGTMHLLRWRAIEIALAEARTEMDLGGVDVAGARRQPVAGEPTFGLYEHKRSFGAEWVELAGARELVVRPWRYTAGRVVARATRALGSVAGRGRSAR